MRNTLKEDVQKVWTEAGPHTEIYERLHEKEIPNAIVFKDILNMYKETQEVKTYDLK